MPRGHTGLPTAAAVTFKKSDLLAKLTAVDGNQASRDRVLQMENHFRTRITTHVGALPATDAKFQKFNTSPFVLLIHCMKRGYTKISEIEADILPAKLFSSMETSAGRMVEQVALPIYGWTPVISEMHTPNSALDGKQLLDDTLRLATLKSGPRCLNDEMSENLAGSIVTHAPSWARSSNVNEIEFTYGVLYGTKRQSNKKDWHILRNISEKTPAGGMTVDPSGRWDCAFKSNSINVSVSVRIGADWWQYLGGPTCLIEVCAAMIRACVAPGPSDAVGFSYVISDLQQIVSLDVVSQDYNVSILQRGQLSWLFFMARHFCDNLLDE